MGVLISLQARIRDMEEHDLGYEHCVFVRDDFTCRVCGVKEENLEVHHTKPFALIIVALLEKHPNSKVSKEFKETLEFEAFSNKDNMLTVCKACHRSIHGSKA